MSKRKGTNLSDFIGSGSHKFEGDLQRKINVADDLDLSSIQTLPADILHRGKYQPRVAEDKDLDQLVESIRQFGVIEPLIVRRRIEDQDYEIVAGHRRCIAAKKAGVFEVPVVICDLDDAEAAILSLVENLQRKDLNPIEEARALARLRDDFDLTQETIAEKVGKPQSVVSRALSLLTLEQNVQEYILDGKLEASHGITLLGLDPSIQSDLAQRAVDGKWSVQTLKQYKKVYLSQEKHASEPSILEKYPVIPQWEARMQEHLVHNKVSVQCNPKGKGRIVIDFNDVDDCKNVLVKLGVIEMSE